MTGFPVWARTPADMMAQPVDMVLRPVGMPLQSMGTLLRPVDMDRTPGLLSRAPAGRLACNRRPHSVDKALVAVRSRFVVAVHSRFVVADTMTLRTHFGWSREHIPPPCHDIDRSARNKIVAPNDRGRLVVVVDHERHRSSAEPADDIRGDIPGNDNNFDLAALALSLWLAPQRTRASVFVGDLLDVASAFPALEQVRAIVRAVHLASVVSFSSFHQPLAPAHRSP